MVIVVVVVASNVSVLDVVSGFTVTMLEMVIVVVVVVSNVSVVDVSVLKVSVVDVSVVNGVVKKFVVKDSRPVVVDVLVVKKDSLVVKKQSSVVVKKQSSVVVKKQSSVVVKESQSRVVEKGNSVQSQLSPRATQTKGNLGSPISHRLTCSVATQPFRATVTSSQVLRAHS